MSGFDEIVAVFDEPIDENDYLRLVELFGDNQFIQMKRSSDGTRASTVQKIQIPEISSNVLNQMEWKQIYSFLLAISRNRDEMRENLLNMISKRDRSVEDTFMNLWLVRSPVWPMLLRNVPQFFLELISLAVGRYGWRSIEEIERKLEIELEPKSISDQTLDIYLRNYRNLGSMGFHVTRWNKDIARSIPLICFANVLYIARGYPHTLNGQRSEYKTNQQMLDEFNAQKSESLDRMLNRAFGFRPSANALDLVEGVYARRGQTYSEAVANGKKPASMKIPNNAFVDATMDILFLRTTESGEDVEAFLQRFLHTEVNPSMLPHGDLLDAIQRANA